MTPRRIFCNGGIPLTVCISGIHEVGPDRLIIAMFDRRLTTLGGWHSQDGSVWKMRTVAKGWWALMAGNSSEITAMGYALQEGLKGAKDKNFLQFARRCVKVYKEERKSLVETEVLSNYDVDSYLEYRALRGSDRDFYDSVTRKIEEFDQTLCCMLCGFEKDKTPHIFVISGPGTLSFCDAQEFGVVGAGAAAAHFSLDKHPYSKRKPLGECIFAILAAKFSAEAAEGVGPDSVLMVFEPMPPWKAQNRMRNEVLEYYKEKWKALPKVPDGVVESLEKAFGSHRLQRPGLLRRRTAKALPKPSNSQTSAGPQ